MGEHRSGERTGFVDDHAPNVEAAASLGIRALRFTDAAALRSALRDLGLLGGDRNAISPD